MSKLITAKSGNIVKSVSEAAIDDFFFDAGYHPIYEPIIEIDDNIFTPDWILLPQKGLSKPVIVEYWGLLRTTNRAGWVTKKLPKYLERKEIKETAYAVSPHYDFLGLYPSDLDNLQQKFTEFLNNGFV